MFPQGFAKRVCTEGDISQQALESCTRQPLVAARDLSLLCYVMLRYVTYGMLCYGTLW